VRFPWLSWASIIMAGERDNCKIDLETNVILSAAKRSRRIPRRYVEVFERDWKPDLAPKAFGAPSASTPLGMTFCFSALVSDTDALQLISNGRAERIRVIMFEWKAQRQFFFGNENSAIQV
jgi:hypothetical protein